MALTRSWEGTLAGKLEILATAKQLDRRRELIWLSIASALICAGLVSVFLAKTEDAAQQTAAFERGEIINLNSVTSAEQILPALQVISPDERGEIAGQIYAMKQRRSLPNVGALARLNGANLQAQSQGPRRIPLAKLKPLLVVRTPAEFKHVFFLWSGLYFAAFWLVHVLWRVRRFKGDPAFLPAIHLLTGIGLILIVSLRDPLRDTLELQKFSWGVIVGCAALLLPLLRAFHHRNFSHWIYTPLFAACALFIALERLGSGPTGSDAKVNLGPFQPVELIKILMVLFLAGYFAKNWERLRDLHQKRFVPRSLRWLELPRLSHVLPVMVAVSCALALFFFLKDMGPALVIGFLFLALFSLARGKAALAAAGMALLVGGVALGYHFGSPHTVVDRVSMWLSPWDNDVRGGDQLAQSLWAFATGGPWGSGLGYGDPSVIPAGHTDLVLPAIAEEWGAPGMIAIFLLFALLIHRTFRIARRASDPYGTFLAAGLGALIAFEILLISGGALDVIPLSGVASPFLSSGNTAMLANFVIAAIIVSISNANYRAAHSWIDNETLAPEKLPSNQRFGVPLRVMGVTLGALGTLLLARAIYLTAYQSEERIAQEAHVFTQDGVKRPERNPRINLLAASIPRGNIYDRNGLLLATSKWDEIEQRRRDFEQLGVPVDRNCSRLDARLYPFGAATVHLLGDLRTGERFHASNSSFVEHDSNQRLQGYSDYHELAAIVPFRHQHRNAQLLALMDRDRSVHTTIDARLQLKADEIMRTHLQATGKKGALLAIDTKTGDVLTLVSWPLPGNDGTGSPDDLLDRARYGQYPPGSTFKLVTALAALSKDATAANRKFSCRRLGDGRAGTIIAGWRRPIRDDVGDHPHGTLDMARAITVSCNAYFAQLGVFAVGSKQLFETANRFGLTVGHAAQVTQALPFASYGQGEALVTPFKLARVVAAIASDGMMPEGRWVSDPSNTRTAAPVKVAETSSSEFLARAMRSVVTEGTARTAFLALPMSVAGKTGTAQLDKGAPHSWFVGFAPYDERERRVAFTVLVEHGGYGAKFAAPIAREFVEALTQLGMLGPEPERR